MPKEFAPEKTHTFKTSYGVTLGEESDGLPQGYDVHIVGHRRTARGLKWGKKTAVEHPLCGRATLETAVRPFQGWPACRALKGRAWRVRAIHQGVHGHPLPNAHEVGN
jgi:hypothetical protein